MLYYLLIIIGVISRMLPHSANFTAVGAIIIFATQKYGYKKGLLLGLIVMGASDIFLKFDFVTLFVYAGFASYALFAYLLRNIKGRQLLSALTGSVGFFVISNFGVWLGPWYEKSISGFINCYISAIPFYRNTLLGDLAFSLVIILVAQLVSKINERREIWHHLLPRKSLAKKS